RAGLSPRLPRWILGVLLFGGRRCLVTSTPEGRRGIALLGGVLVDHIVRHRLPDLLDEFLVGGLPTLWFLGLVHQLADLLLTLGDACLDLPESTTDRLHVLLREQHGIGLADDLLGDPQVVDARLVPRTDPQHLRQTV